MRRERGGLAMLPACENRKARGGPLILEMRKWGPRGVMRSGQSDLFSRSAVEPGAERILPTLNTAWCGAGLEGVSYRCPWWIFVSDITLPPKRRVEVCRGIF